MEPVLLKSLKSLRATSDLLTERDIAQRVKEDQIYVAKALEKLIQRDIVTKNGEFYHYQNTPINEDFYQKILAVYDKVTKKPKIEFICKHLAQGICVSRKASSMGMRFLMGIDEDELYLSHFGFLRGITEDKPYLFHLGTLQKILEEEGFDLEEISFLLEKEMKDGWINKVEFYLGSKEQITSPAPIRIASYPFYFGYKGRTQAYGTVKTKSKDRELITIYPGRVPFAPPSGLNKIMNTEELEKFKENFKEKWENLAWFIRKEDYLLGRYPFELASPAREYLDNEKPEIKETFSGEAFEW